MAYKKMLKSGQKSKLNAVVLSQSYTAKTTETKAIEALANTYQNLINQVR